jgi:quercetin dioxygenase-like cupin family protein
MQAFYAEFPVRATFSTPHRHDGAELIFVLKGQLAVEVEGEATTLDAGDAMYLDSAVPHRYRGQGRSICTALVVVAP